MNLSVLSIRCGGLRSVLDHSKESGSPLVLNEHLYH